MAKKSTLFGKPKSQVIKRPGALTAKAKAHGKTVTQFCNDLGPKASTRTKRQCALAKTMRSWSKKRKK